MDLFEELEKAINKGDKDAIAQIQRKILLGGRDTTIDENFIGSIKGKTLYKNIVRSISEGTEFETVDYAKLVSSLITHYLIESQTSGRPTQDFPIQELYVILGGFVNEADKEKAIQDAKDFIKDRYGEFL